MVRAIDSRIPCQWRKLTDMARTGKARNSIVTQSAARQPVGIAGKVLRGDKALNVLRQASRVYRESEAQWYALQGYTVRDCGEYYLCMPPREVKARESKPRQVLPRVKTAQSPATHTADDSGHAVRLTPDLLAALVYQPGFGG